MATIAEYRYELWPISKLVESRYQMRMFDDEVELQSLAFSIKNRGLLDEPRVRPHPSKEGFAEIMTGHRRVKAAAKYLGWTEIMCRVDLRALSELDVYLIAGEDNIKRRDLTAEELAKYYQMGAKKFKVTAEELAKIHGIAASDVILYLGLAETLDEAQEISRDPLKLRRRLAEDERLFESFHEIRVIVNKKRGDPADLVKAVEMITNDCKTYELKEYLEQVRQKYLTEDDKRKENVSSPRRNQERELLSVLDKLASIDRVEDLRRIRPRLREMRKTVVGWREDSQLFGVVETLILSKPQVCPPHDVPAQVSWKLLDNGKAQFIRKAIPSMEGTSEIPSTWTAKGIEIRTLTTNQKRDT